MLVVVVVVVCAALCKLGWISHVPGVRNGGADLDVGGAAEAVVVAQGSGGRGICVEPEGGSAPRRIPPFLCVSL